MNTIEDEIVACESGYDITLGGNYDAMMESYDDDLAVVEAMHAYDMAELEAMKESGAEFTATPVMEASMKEVWEKIKKFFANLGARIMAFFKSAIDYVASLVMSGAAFAKKYEERLKGAKFELKGYEAYEYSISSNEFGKDVNLLKSHQKFAADRCKQVADASGYEALLAANNKFDADKGKKLADLRKALAGTEDSEKFTEALFNKFRSGGKKKTMTITDASKYLDFLKDESLLKNVKAAREAVATAFKEINSSINKAASEASSNKEDTKLGSAKAAAMRSSIAFFSSMQNAYTRYINAWNSAAKEATGVYKNICFKALSYKPEKK